MSVVCFAHVETTGTDPRGHHLWEIGLIRRDLADAGRVPDVEYAWQVRPDMRFADPRALQIGRFYQRCKPKAPGAGHVLTHPELPRAARELDPGPRKPVGQLPQSIAGELAELLDEATLVAINVDSAAAFLTKFLRGNGQCPTWNHHKVEALCLAAGHLHLPPPWTSGSITAALGVAAEKDRHTGLGDARLVRDIYDAVYTTA